MSSIKKRVTSWLVANLCWLFHCTYRYRFLNPHYFATAKANSKNGNVALAAWHNNCLPSLMAHQKEQLCVLVSRSFDGELIAKAAERLGLCAVRGSSSRGGRAALLELIRRVRKGESAGIAVDGPKGPVGEVKPGIFALASKTEAPIVPVAAVGHAYWSLQKTWDQFRIPRPFTKVYIVYGPPMHLTRDTKGDDIEQSQILKERLDHLEVDINRLRSK